MINQCSVRVGPVGKDKEVVEGDVERPEREAEEYGGDKFNVY